MLRTIAAALAGLVAAMITVWAFQFASVRAFPPPPGVDVLDPMQLARMPPGALGLALAGWVVGALDGGLAAAAIAKRRLPAIVVGVLAMLGALLVVALVPHPVWMSVAVVLLPVPAAIFGAWLVRGRADAA